jgi:hypothetical protein
LPDRLYTNVPARNASISSDRLSRSRHHEVTAAPYLIKEVHRRFEEACRDFLDSETAPARPGRAYVKVSDFQSLAAHELVKAPADESLQVKRWLLAHEHPAAGILAKTQVEVFLQRLFQRPTNEKHTARPKQLYRTPYEQARLAHVLEDILRDNGIERLGFERGCLEQLATQIEPEAASAELRHLGVQLDTDHIVPCAASLIEEEATGCPDLEQARTR